MPAVGTFLRSVIAREQGEFIDGERLPKATRNPNLTLLLNIMRLDGDFASGAKSIGFLGDTTAGKPALSFTAETWETSTQAQRLRTTAYLQLGLLERASESLSFLLEHETGKALGNSISLGLMRSVPYTIDKTASDVFAKGLALHCFSAGNVPLNYLLRIEDALGDDRLDATGSIARVTAQMAKASKFLPRDLTAEQAINLVVSFTKMSNLQHVFAPLLQRVDRAAKNDPNFRFWSERAIVAKTPVFDSEGLEQVAQKAVESGDFECAARTAYHLPFAGVTREREAALLSAMADRFAPRTAPLPATGTKREALHIVFCSAYLANHGIAHVMHQFVTHLKAHGIGYSILNCGTVVEDDIYQRNIFAHADAVREIKLLASIGGMQDDRDGEALRAASAFIRQQQADICINLDGYMSIPMLRIGADRPAPINIYWVGHGGNLGLGHFDYIINDRFLASEPVPGQELEQEIRLPSAFVTSGVFDFDRSRTKADLGYPDDAVLINAFNNHMKIDRHYLDCLAQVLRAAPKAVVLFNNPAGKDSASTIARYLVEQGLSEAQFGFQDRVNPKSEHYTRLHAHDFAMDTFHVSMSSGTLDNMWAELPTVARPGDSYYSRICGSFNAQIGLPELNCDTSSAYVDKAISLATNPGLLADIRHHIRTHKTKTSMFDGEMFAAEFAAAMRAVVAHAQAGKAPANLNIEALFPAIEERR